jgi:ABC-type Fe3+/spermidine/putrescine transport system ATPase subunit
MLVLRYELRRLVRDLGITTIHVTHDQEEALTIADRIIVIRNGKIIQSGSPQEIYYRPATPYIHHFVGEANFTKGDLISKEEKTCKVKDKGGRIFIAGQTNLQVGTRVAIGVKTEFTMLHKENKGLQNTLEGTVERKLFMGRVTDFEVVLRTGGTVHARLPSSLAYKFAEGDKAYASATPEKMLVFKEPKIGLRKELALG